uniref:Mutator-like transposase domain-containing protein n=1 Tax=Amphimedon queenslandica TaxID=400682 RepID=A0A1X7USZ7_AMPQE
MSAPDGVGSLKKRARREGFRYQMELNFGQKEDKDHFLARLDRVKGSLATKRRRPVDNMELLSHLLDLAEKEESEVQSQDTSSSSAMLNTSGIYAGDGDEEQPLFVCEVSAFEDLVLGMTRWCTCGMVNRKMISYRQSGHVIRAEFQCQSCNRKEWWASSSLLGSRYLINQKLIHAFTCAGMLPSQYYHFCRLASLGTVGKRYTDSVYNSKGYVAAIESCAEASMTKAIDEIKATSEYETDGEWVITDARHDSTANAYHTTVPCLSGSIHKIVGCVTLSRKEHTCAQTRELACTKEVLPLVMSKGLNVTEVAHDNSPSVTSYIVEELQLKNSYDTWHGTKNVAKAMTSIATGTKKRAGITWYPELSDKRKSTKTHLYYSMKNCNKSPENLRDSITNIVDHYRGKHSNCNQSSSCRRPGYAPSKKLITDPNAVEAYTRKLKQTLIYVNAESYCSEMSGYILGGVIQSSSTHLSPQKDSFRYYNLQNENEYRSYGLE